MLPRRNNVNIVRDKVGAANDAKGVRVARTAVTAPRVQSSRSGRRGPRSVRIAHRVLKVSTVEGLLSTDPNFTIWAHVNLCHLHVLQGGHGGRAPGLD